MENNFLVRILKIKLHNFKNVKNGEIEFMNYSSAVNNATIENVDLLGIYGQNGSGKTAMIEALDILQHIISGEEIKFSDFEGLISDDNSTQITTLMYIDVKDKKFKVEYDVVLKKNIETKKIEIHQEELTFWNRNETWGAKKSISFKNPFYEIDAMLKLNMAEIQTYPQAYKSNLKFTKILQNLGVYCAQKNTSIFFNDLMHEALDNENKEVSATLGEILKNISIFARGYFHVVKVNQLGVINSSNIIPINFHQEHEGVVSNGCLPLFINGYGIIPEKVYQELESAINAINIALKSIIPNLTIKLERISEEIDKEGVKTVKVNAYSIRNNKKFLTKYESEGIKRIISLLNYIISVYNHPEICLVIDELDSGIFEYLLGDLLETLFEGTKGQLIFTSHNLRVLERLSTKNIVCSTANPDNRYVTLKGVGANNNNRDFYIRALTLGGQDEELYDNQELQSLDYALRKSGSTANSIELEFSDEMKKLFEVDEDKRGEADA